MIDPTPADDNALLIAVIFEDFEIDHTPDGWPAVKQMHLSAAAAELERQHADDFDGNVVMATSEIGQMLDELIAELDGVAK